jgi:hypothetical protein
VTSSRMREVVRVATSGDIRIGVDKLVRSITVYGDNVIDAAVDAAELAGEAGARVIAEVIKIETTDTGLARASSKKGGEPGRIKSGDLYNSIYDDQFNESTGSAHVLTTRGGNISLKFGFIASPEYAKYQEEGSVTIRGMHALQQAFTVAREVFFDELAIGLRQAGEDAAAGRVLQRNSKLGKRGL